MCTIFIGLKKNSQKIEMRATLMMMPALANYFILLFKWKAKKCARYTDIRLYQIKYHILLYSLKLKSMCAVKMTTLSCQMPYNRTTCSNFKVYHLLILFIFVYTYTFIQFQYSHLFCISPQLDLSQKHAERLWEGQKEAFRVDEGEKGEHREVEDRIAMV